MNAVTRRHVLFACIAPLAIASVCQCGEDEKHTTTPASTLEQLMSDGTLSPPEQAIAACGTHPVCIWLAPGSGEAHSGAYVDGSELGVFNGVQGRVATWFTVVVIGAPGDGFPKLLVDIESGDESLNIVNNLNIPIKRENGYAYRDQYMVELIEPCCAADYAGREVEVSAILQFEGLPAAEYTFTATLTETSVPQ